MSLFLRALARFFVLFCLGEVRWGEVRIHRFMVGLLCCGLGKEEEEEGVIR